MKKITLELPENKEELINCLKKIDKNLVNKENDTHYLIPSHDLIENVVFMDKYDLVIKIYQGGYVCVFETIGSNVRVLENNTFYKYAYLTILEHLNKI
jgi:hypothetical protein